jgi:hypothetical protein
MVCVRLDQFAHSFADGHHVLVGVASATRTLTRTFYRLLLITHTLCELGFLLKDAHPVLC